MSNAISIVLEGATYQGSVAILRDAEVLAERSIEEGETPGKRSGDRLMPAVSDAMKAAGAERRDIVRIVCGSGPGSFTSLRVAGSIAKGLATGYDVPLFAVNSLLLTVAGSGTKLVAGSYLSILNAMRGEYFALRVEVAENGYLLPVDGIRMVSGQELSRLAVDEPTLKCIGPGQELDVLPHARGAARLLGDILSSGSVDLTSWEPNYGRLAEAQVKWEAAHGRPLTA